MAITRIKIINAALALVGAKKLTAITDNRTAAELADDFYELSENEMFSLPLELDFAVIRTDLSRRTETPVGSYDYMFDLPSKCARVKAQIDEDDDNIEYEHRVELYITVDDNNRQFEHRVLLSHESTAYIKYVHVVEDCSLWPAWFTRLVYINLAILLCEPLKQDKQKKNQLIVMFDEALKVAKAVSGMEGADVSDDNVNVDVGNDDVLGASDINTEEGEYVEHLVSDSN